jgi:hypothetical protein
MKMRIWFITLLFGIWTGAAHAEDWQVVLLKPRGCDACVYVEEMLKRGAQLRQTVLDDGAGSQVTATILRRSSAELSEQEWAQLRALPWFDERQWRRRVTTGAAQVLLKRDGVIVSAGDIADSADLRSARFPAALILPDVGRDVGEVRGAQSSFLAELYLRTWNLNWFYRLARDPSILRSRASTALVANNTATLTPPLGTANVLLMSTASGAPDNEIFNALRIEELRAALAQSTPLDPARLRIFYGGGNSQGANALEVRDGRMSLVRRNVADANPFTPEAIGQIFQSIRAQPGSRNLLVLIGHGSPDGAGMWSSPAPLPPATLRALHEHSGGDNVLVSGNCFGGIMARAMSCGFFGARPDIVATGCQADAAQVAQSRDYLHMFFSSLAPGARRLVDSDADGAVSFAEAHWYASAEGDPRNVTYTSIDALADAWFDVHPESLPGNLAVRDILTLAAAAPPAEARAVRNLLNGYDTGMVLSLKNLAEQAERWNPASGQPRAMVSQLTRRLLYLKNNADQRQEIAQLQACENRSVAGFLKP